MHGFILVDKPRGPSSFEVLRKLNKRFNLGHSGHKIGHGGTLDPMASGLLVVAIGKATRLLQFFLGSDKRYTATLQFGMQTRTLDAEGEIVARAPYAHITPADVGRALRDFRGTILQTPPDFSALHVDGKRAYDLARKGIEVQIPPREITIHAIEIIDCGLPDTPALTLDIACSGGTYIRAIARDLGRALHSEAHLTALRRTGVCHFDLSQARPLQEILDLPDLASVLTPCAKALGFLPALPASHDDIRRLLDGRPVDFHPPTPGNYRIQTPDGILHAVLTHTPDRDDFVRLPLLSTENP